MNELKVVNIIKCALLSDRYDLCLLTVNNSSMSIWVCLEFIFRFDCSTQQYKRIKEKVENMGEGNNKERNSNDTRMIESIHYQTHFKELLSWIIFNLNTLNIY